MLDTTQRMLTAEVEPRWVHPQTILVREAPRGRAFLPNLVAVLILAIGVAAYLEGQPLAVWAAALPALWLALQAPERLIGLLLITTPMFPVIRVLEDRLGAQEVSTRGLYFTLDDPLILALLCGAIIRQLTRRGRAIEWFPSAFLALAAFYPLVIALNTTRLEPAQSMLSFLYYLKWLQYASVLLLIPAILPPGNLPNMMRILRRALAFVLTSSALLAVYETVEALRTGSYRSAGGFPRASSFFGTLDPRRFGASEDPVNFGVFMMIGGALALAFATQSRRRPLSHALTLVASVLGVLLSASRTPLLAAGAAYSRLRKISFNQAILLLFGLAIIAGGMQILFPSMWSTTLVRFESILFEEMAIDGSAESRLAIMLNAPVFTWDNYSLSGHGHSAYRFIAEQHLSSFAHGVSRSLYNFGLTIWYDVGPFGLLLWSILFLQLRKRLLRTRSSAQNPELRALSAGLHAALIGIATASLFGEFPYNWRVMGFFYLCYGICLAAARAERPAQTRTPLTSPPLTHPLGGA